MKRCQKVLGEYNYSKLQCDDRAGSSRLRRVSTNRGEKEAPPTAHQAADKSRQICSVLLGLGIQHHSGSNTKGHHRPVGAGTLFNQTMGSYLQRFSFDLNTKVFCVASTCIRLPSWPPSTYFLNQVCYIRGVLQLEHFCGNK